MLVTIKKKRCVVTTCISYIATFLVKVLRVEDVCSYLGYISRELRTAH